MTEQKAKVKLTVDKKKMEDKRYNPFALGVISVDTVMLKENHTRVIPVQDCKDRLKKAGLSNYKIKRFLDESQEIGVIEINGEDCIVSSIEGRFVSIYVETIKYCTKVLSPLSFKVYCYLKSWYQTRQVKHYKENYFFSRAEIIRSLGMYVDKNTTKTIDMCLRTLKKIGLIDYADKAVCRKGTKGKYTELYKVNEWCVIERESEKHIEKTMKDEKNIDPMLWFGGKMRTKEQFKKIAESFDNETRDKHLEHAAQLGSNAEYRDWILSLKTENDFVF